MRVVIGACCALALGWWASPAQADMTWQQRESWIVGEENEEQTLVNEIALELGISTALVLYLPELELGWLANCADAAHSAHGAATVQSKIDRYLALKVEIPRQWNLLTQQLQNNPTEWHRFQQTQIPYLEWKDHLMKQGSRMKAPTGCSKRTPPPTRKVEAPPNCTGLFAQERALSQAMIFQYSPETKAPLKQQLDQVEQEILQEGCRRGIASAPPSRQGVCGVQIRC